MDQRTLQRIFYGALTLLALGAAGYGIDRAGAEGIAFALFAVMTIGGALVCIWERSVVRSAFALLSTFLGVAGLFVLLQSDFLAMAQILIYAGGVLALILFGVMLTPPDLGERKLSRVLAGLVCVGAAVTWVVFEVAATAQWATPALAAPSADDSEYSTARRIGVGFLQQDGYVVAFELAAVVLTVALVAAVYIARRKPEDLTPPGAVTQESGEAS